MVKFLLNNQDSKFVFLLVVPATTMNVSVVIGRDILKQFYEDLELTNETYEDEVIREILNIDINDLDRKKHIGY